MDHIRKSKEHLLTRGLKIKAVSFITLLMVFSITVKVYGFSSWSWPSLNRCPESETIKSETRTLPGYFGTLNDFSNIYTNKGDNYWENWCLEGGWDCFCEIYAPYCQLALSYEGKGHAFEYFDGGRPNDSACIQIDNAKWWDPNALRMYQKKCIENNESCQKLNDARSKHAKEIAFCEHWYQCGKDHNYPGFACHNEISEQTHNENYEGIGSKCASSGPWYREDANLINFWLLSQVKPSFVNQPCTVNNADLQEATDLASGILPPAFSIAAKSQYGAEPTWAFEHICYNGAYEYEGEEYYKEYQVWDDGKQYSLLQCADNAENPACFKWNEDAAGCPGSPSRRCIINKQINITEDIGIDQPINIDSSSKTWPFNIDFSAAATEGQPNAESISSALTAEEPAEPAQTFSIHPNPGFKGDSVFMVSGDASVTVSGINFDKFKDINIPIVKRAAGAVKILSNRFGKTASLIKNTLTDKCPQTLFINNRFDNITDQSEDIMNFAKNPACKGQYSNIKFEKMEQLYYNIYRLVFTMDNDIPIYALEINKNGEPAVTLCSYKANKNELDAFAKANHMSIPNSDTFCNPDGLIEQENGKVYITLYHKIHDLFTPPLTDAGLWGKWLTEQKEKIFSSDTVKKCISDVENKYSVTGVYHADSKICTVVIDGETKNYAFGGNSDYKDTKDGSACSVTTSYKDWGNYTAELKACSSEWGAAWQMASSQCSEYDSNNKCINHLPPGVESNPPMDLLISFYGKGKPLTTIAASRALIKEVDDTILQQHAQGQYDNAEKEKEKKALELFDKIASDQADPCVKGGACCSADDECLSKCKTVNACLLWKSGENPIAGSFGGVDSKVYLEKCSTSDECAYNGNKTSSLSELSCGEYVEYDKKSLKNKMRVVSWTQKLKCSYKNLFKVPGRDVRPSEIDSVKDDLNLMPKSNLKVPLDPEPMQKQQMFQQQMQDPAKTPGMGN